MSKKLEDRILLLLKVAGDRGCTSLDMAEILKPWFGAHWPALAALEKGGRVRSEWLPLQHGRKHRRRIYFLPWCGQAMQERVNPAEYETLTDELCSVTHGLLRIIGGRDPAETSARAVRAHALMLRLHSLAFPVATDGPSQALTSGNTNDDSQQKE